MLLGRTASGKYNHRRFHRRKESPDRRRTEDESAQIGRYDDNRSRKVHRISVRSKLKDMLVSSPLQESTIKLFVYLVYVCVQIDVSNRIRAKWFVDSALVPLRLFQELCEEEFLKQADMMKMNTAQDLKSKEVACHASPTLE